MKSLNLNPYAALLVLVALLTGCSGSEEHSATSSSNAPQQANSNAASQPQIAQGNAPVVAPNPAPPAVQSIPPLPPPAGREAAMVNQSAADPKNASTAANARVPKLVVPGKKIDYGKQPQGITLVRAIVIKNGGRANLNIDAVVPACGCTTVDFPKVLRPGQAGTIKVKVDTGKSPGPHTKSMTIKSNDPTDPSRVVQFSYLVKG